MTAIRKVRERLRRVPSRVKRIVGLLLAVNVAVWVIVIVVLCALKHQSLLSTAALAYSLGLRHALDADHITAIDLATRRLVAIGRKPVSVGSFFRLIVDMVTWFSLGHSTIVIVTCLVVAASSASISDRFGSFSSVGGIIGSSVSTAFLLVLGVFNTYTIWVLVGRLRRYVDVKDEKGVTPAAPSMVGPIGRACNGLFRLIDRPWKLYPIGVLFGLGFDTSSEIALLGIASIQGSHGTSIWLILIFPALFTAGMCLIDTLDGAVMGAVYTMHAEDAVESHQHGEVDDEHEIGMRKSPVPEDRATSGAGNVDDGTNKASYDSPTPPVALLPELEREDHLAPAVMQQSPDAGVDVKVNATTGALDQPPPALRPAGLPLAYLYYSTLLTSLTSLIAIFIGIVQLLTLLQNAIHPTPTGRFWDGVSALGDAYDILGAAICGMFVAVLSVAAVGWGRFRLWAEKRRAEAMRRRRQAVAVIDEENEAVTAYT